jgi:hypothetical protein
MIITEKQLKKIVSEEVQKALTGRLNVPEYDVNKSIQRLVPLIDQEADAFYEKYKESGDKIYEAYATELWAITENRLEKFLKKYKEGDIY